MEIGDALKRFRAEYGLSQRQVTEKIGIAVPQQWQKYEYKQMTPSAEIIVKVAKAFDVSADYLLGLSDKPRPKSVDEDLVEAVTAYRKAMKTFDKFLETKGIE